MHAREQKLELVSAPTPEPGRQGTAVVVSRGPEAIWLVEDRGQQREARRAASCLLEPAVGDTVWIVAEGDRCWVLGVLERSADTPATLRIDSDAALHVDGKLGVHTTEIQVEARVGRVFVRECTAVLRSLLTHATTSTLVAKVVETLADQVVTSSKTSTRTVTEIDQLHAGIIDHHAVEAAQIAADKVLINGGEIAKVEAGQIHLG